MGNKPVKCSKIGQSPIKTAVQKGVYKTGEFFKETGGKIGGAVGNLLNGSDKTNKKTGEPKPPDINDLPDIDDKPTFNVDDFDVGKIKIDATMPELPPIAKKPEFEIEHFKEEKGEAPANKTANNTPKKASTASTTANSNSNANSAPKRTFASTTSSDNKASRQSSSTEYYTAYVKNENGERTSIGRFSTREAAQEATANYKPDAE